LPFFGNRGRHARLMGCGASLPGMEQQATKKYRLSFSGDGSPKVRVQLDDTFEPTPTVKPVKPKVSVDISKLVNPCEISMLYYFTDRFISKRTRVMIRLVTAKRNERFHACKQHSLRDNVAGGRLIRSPETIKGQVNILDRCRHPNIIKLHEVFMNPVWIYEILEYCSGGRLYDAIVAAERHTARETANVMYQLLSAVAHLHTRKVCHRDIRPEHVMIKDNGLLTHCEIKIIDFATACEIKKVPFTEQLAMPYYASPQVYEKKYTYKCDIWSCGLILYLLLLGYPRLRTANQMNPRLMGPVLQSFLTEGVFSPIEEYKVFLTDDVLSILDQLMATEENERCSAEAALSCDWMRYQKPQPPALGIFLEGVPLNFNPGEAEDRAGMLY